MRMSDDEKSIYLRGYSHGYRDGHQDGIENKSQRDQICKKCGIDLERARVIQYDCKISSCDYSEKVHEKHT